MDANPPRRGSDGSATVHELASPLFHASVAGSGAERTHWHHELSDPTRGLSQGRHTPRAESLTQDPVIAPGDVDGASTAFPAKRHGLGLAEHRR